jgi:hypothetical protein
VSVVPMRLIASVVLRSGGAGALKITPLAGGGAGPRAGVPLPLTI